MAKQDSSHVIISRKAAKSAGLRHYFTGRPCKRGHVLPRLVSCSQCCGCGIEHLQAYRKGNRAKYRELNRRQKDKDRAKIRDRDRKRYWKDPVKATSRVKAYYQGNKEKVKARRREYHHSSYRDEEVRRRAAERTKKWSERNPDKAARARRVSKHRRRSREASAAGAFDAADLAAIMISQRNKCAICRIQLGTKYHVDHITPLATGGSNNRANIQILCKPCNLRKGARDPIDHMRSLGMLL